MANQHNLENKDDNPLKLLSFLGILFIAVVSVLCMIFYFLYNFNPLEDKWEKEITTIQFLSFVLVILLIFLFLHSIGFLKENREKTDKNAILLKGTFDYIFLLGENGSILDKNLPAELWLKSLGMNSIGEIASLLDGEVLSSIMKNIRSGLRPGEIQKWESKINSIHDDRFYEIFLHKVDTKTFITVHNITDRKRAEISLQEFYKSMAEDLEIARETQKVIMSSPLPRNEFLIVESYYKPYLSVSGDIIGSYTEDNDSYHFIFGDVTGHGTASGLISCAVALAFQTTARENLTPADVLQSLHRILKSITYAHLLSAVCLSICRTERKIKYSYAGHHSCYVIRNGKFMELEGKGHPLLSIIEPQTFDYELSFEKGDQVFLFSDGLFELLDKDSNILGQKTFIQFAKKIHSQYSGSFLNQIGKEILTICDGHQLDDMTMLLLEIRE